MAAPDTTPGTRLGGARLALALALLFGGGAIWGLGFSAAKLVTEAGAHPFGLSLVAGFFGAAILLPYCIARRRPPPLGRDDLVFYVVAGLLGTALPSAVLYSAAAQASRRNGLRQVCVPLTACRSRDIDTANGRQLDSELWTV